MRLIRCKALCHQLGFSRTTIWRWVREGTFPAPIKVNAHSIAWRKEDVDAWIANSAENRKAS